MLNWFYRNRLLKKAKYYRERADYISDYSQKLWAYRMAKDIEEMAWLLYPSKHVKYKRA